MTFGGFELNAYDIVLMAIVQNNWKKNWFIFFINCHSVYSVMTGAIGQSLRQLHSSWKLNIVCFLFSDNYNTDTNIVLFKYAKIIPK